MRRKVVAAVAALLFILTIAPASHAQDGSPETKVAPAAKVPAKAAPTSTTKKSDEPKMPGEVPKTGGEALAAARDLLEQAKAKQWFAFSAGAIWLFMFLFKFGRKTIGFMQKIPKRALWIMVPIASVAAMVLAKLQTDMSWTNALAVLFSGPSVAFLNDLVKRGVMGKEPSPVNGGSG